MRIVKKIKELQQTWFYARVLIYTFFNRCFCILKRMFSILSPKYNKMPNNH